MLNQAVGEMVSIAIFGVLIFASVQIGRSRGPAVGIAAFVAGGALMALAANAGLISLPTN